MLVRLLCVVVEVEVGRMSLYSVIRGSALRFGAVVEEGLPG